MMGGFWEDVEDLRTTVEFLRSDRGTLSVFGSPGLSVDAIIGHSRGGQLVICPCDYVPPHLRPNSASPSPHLRLTSASIPAKCRLICSPAAMQMRWTCPECAA
jgi:hypothetical protein